MIAVSTASDPEPQRNTRDDGIGDSPVRRSASSSASGLENGSKQEYASSVLDLGGDGVGDVLTAVADVAVPQAGHGVDQLGAVGSPEQGALAADDGDERRPGRLGEGMRESCRPPTRT